MSEDMKMLVPQNERDKIESILNEVQSYECIKITTNEQMDNANEIMKDLKKSKKILTERQDDLKAPHYKKYKYILAEFKKPLEIVENAIKKFNDAICERTEQLRLEREEKQRKLDLIAEQTRRREEEKAQEKIREAEELRKQGKERMAERREAAAEQHLNVAENTVAPVVETKKLDGTHFVTYYEAEIVDKKEAGIFLASTPAYQGLLNIDLKGLGRIQKQFDGKLEVPGIKFTRKTRSSSRT